ncbi:hypothetical protein N7448_006644 [Penicillium atrosanguineum]|nr:hypothetical protein N7448_006644 [Penicillium atrosanguineum]KAJ5137300.1 hypothetical protein N7526_003533 [Penicillium atrosanguineum]
MTSSAELNMILRDLSAFNMGRGAYDTTGVKKPGAPPAASEMNNLRDTHLHTCFRSAVMLWILSGAHGCWSLTPPTFFGVHSLSVSPYATHHIGQQN